jgi:hypothetical protein
MILPGMERLYSSFVANKRRVVHRNPSVRNAVLFPQLLQHHLEVNFTSDKISAATATFISLSAAFNKVSIVINLTVFSWILSIAPKNSFENQTLGDFQ